jgi:hypothetical protein
VRGRASGVCWQQITVIDVSGAAALLIARGRPTWRVRDQMRSGVAVEPVD